MSRRHTRSEKARLLLEVLPQPDDMSCGPTCLHAIYRYFGDELPLAQIAREVPHMKDGGTFGVILGCHAVQRGYRATIFTYNLQTFDPTWFDLRRREIIARLLEQIQFKKNHKLRMITPFYCEFLKRGGRLRFEDLTRATIRRYLNRGVPILAGLNSTFLYRSKRVFGPREDDDDIRGLVAGHFVVLCGYDRAAKTVLVADPYRANPYSSDGYYEIDIDRVICAILLGIITYDANLLIVEPRNREM